MKFSVAVLALATSANAFSVAPSNRAFTALFNGPSLGSGGMADTRDPSAMAHEDARKSISAAPSFEEYLKMRDGGGGAPAAAPAAPAPVAAPAAAAWAAPAAAAPAAPAAGAGGNYGKYDDQMFDMAAKQDVYSTWDPNAPRSEANFNPFETWDGNSPDASGYFPGERRYKDPKRGDVSYAIMQVEQTILDDIKANPKPGNVAGAPGLRSSQNAYSAPAAAAPAAPAAAAWAPPPAAAAPAAAAWAPPPAAAAPAAPAAAAGAAGDYGKYDDQMFDMAAKQDVYSTWDPNAPRSEANFNPFETWDGNSPDASGYFPGERRYKDPKRGDVSYAIMQVEQGILDGIKANPKPGNTPGAPGCRN